MSETNPRELLERERARLLAEAATKRAEAEMADAKAAAVERDMAELDRIAARYNLTVTAGTAPARSTPESPLTLRSLAEWYCTDERSPYRGVRPSSRATYDKMIKQINNLCGDTKVSDLDAQRIQELYNKWADHGKIAMGHAFITQLRGLVRFGMNELKDKDCEKVAFILHGLHFQTVEPRKESLTETQVEAIRSRAHELGLHSIALAQAFQFYCGFKQADVIGEWVPIDTTTPPTEFTRGSEKWVRGFRYNEIEDGWILRGIRLTDFPVVFAEITEEIRRLGKRPVSAPIIMDEHTQRPYTPNNFRLAWRKAAHAAGIPKEIRNMDSRPKRNEGVRQNKQNELQRSRPL
jgi:Phage integrase, N-terminal SAM-like domain